MRRNLLRTSAYSLFLLGAISLVAFGLSLLVPGDVVLDYMSIDEKGYSHTMNPAEQREIYARVAQKRGLDLPPFYWSLSPGYLPDSLRYIVYREDCETVEAWITHTLQGPQCLALYRALRQALEKSCRSGQTTPGSASRCQDIGRLLLAHELVDLHRGTAALAASAARDTGAWSADLRHAHRLVEDLIRNGRHSTGVNWLPHLTWNGTHNQYHQWIAGLITARPLTSLIDGRNAWTKVGEAVRWTLLMNGLALVIAFFLGLRIGTWSAAHDGQWVERALNTLLFVLFALPSFWLATLLITGFASGEWLSIFPSGGLGAYQKVRQPLAKAGIILWHLVLPVLCLTLGALAYVSRQMKSAVLHQLGQPYVHFFRTQGLPERLILRRHAVPNALFPMITLAGQAVPGLLSGSLLMEVIFSIPGLGRLLYTSLLARDWPVVFPILMIGAAVTVVAYLLTDMIYRRVDPRVKTHMG